MEFYGFIKTSLINYPGQIASVLFTGGCNLKCSYCYNRDLVLAAGETISQQEVLEHISRRKKMVPAVVISGGEPSLHSGLTQFLKLLKQIGVLVKVDTNGLFPDRVAEWLESSVVDYMAVDIKTSPSKYSELTGTKVDFDLIERTVGLLKNSSVPYELRTTVVPGFFDENDISEITARLGKVRAWYLQQFINEGTLNSEFEKLIPVSKEKLVKLADALRPFAEHCEIRGI